MAVRALLLLLFVSPVFHFKGLAQSSRETVNQSIEWFTLAANVKVSPRLSLHGEGIFRFVRGFEPMQFQVRGAAEININKRFSIVPFGYVFTWNPIYGKQPNAFVNNEHRIWEQLTFKYTAGRISMSHRLRVEQRYFQVHSLENGELVYYGYDLYTNRARYRFAVNIAVNHPSVTDNTFYVTAYDEIFLSWGKNVGYHRPDQNRLFAGLGYQFNKTFGLQGGPFWQLLIKANGTKQENNIGVLLQLTYHLDLTKDAD